METRRIARLLSSCLSLVLAFLFFAVPPAAEPIPAAEGTPVVVAFAPAALRDNGHRSAATLRGPPHFSA